MTFTGGQMPAVSLTTFVDFVAATGTARITKVRDAKRYYEQGYAPERDFYKPLRDRIEATFEDGWSAKSLRDALADVTDPKKIENYEESRAGLTKWVGRKTITTLPQRRMAWKSGDLDVNVNPELHIEINDKPHLIKMYLKAEPLSKQKANVVLHLLAQKAKASTTVGVLDVRRSKLYTPTVDIDGMDALLTAEAVAFTTMWNSV
jgi:hypothetical protein